MKTLALLCLLLSAPAFAGGINQPTSAQLRCRQNAPATPKKIVFGFAGWLSYLTSYGLIHGMMGNAADASVEFHYYPWNGAYRDNLTDAVRCAYELAVKPYRLRDGRVAYNRIVSIGHSFGGNGAHDLAAALGKLGIAVDLVSTADARDPGNSPGAYAPSWARPHNVTRYLNFYEKNDAIFPGFPVAGAENVRIGGVHLTAPMQPATVQMTESALAGMRTSRASFSRVGQP